MAIGGLGGCDCPACAQSGFDCEKDEKMSISQRNRNNRRKGHDFERYVANLFKQIDETAKRNLEYQEGSYDIETKLRFTVQCKCTNVWTPSPSESLRQAKSALRRDSFALATHKIKGGETFAVMYLEDFMAMIAHYASHDRYLWMDCPQYLKENPKELVTAFQDDSAKVL